LIDLIKTRLSDYKLNWSADELDKAEELQGWCGQKPSVKYKDVEALMVFALDQDFAENRLEAIQVKLWKGLHNPERLGTASVSLLKRS